jgi:putative transposase
MPRPPRVQPAGGVFHVTTRGNRGQPIYLDEADRLLFLRILRRVMSAARWRQLAWCLMTNHFHLVIQTPTESLAIGMQRLNGLYARRFNARHSLQGHLFERRYYARFIDSEEQLEATVRYVAMNPVRAGLCQSPTDWQWCDFHGAAKSYAFDP